MHLMDATTYFYSSNAKFKFKCEPKFAKSRENQHINKHTSNSSFKFKCVTSFCGSCDDSTYKLGYRMLVAFPQVFWLLSTCPPVTSEQE